jgi:site-specific DNA recombinase
MNVAAYARVSTQRQAEDQTMAQQIERLQAPAQREGWTLEAGQGYRDEGDSGARIDRPALDRLRDAAERGECQAVLITAPDRWARRFVQQALLLEELAPCGCPVIVLEHPLSQDPNDQLLLQIRGAVAEYERALIADRTRRGRLAKRRSWPWRPWITTPDGYRCDPEHPRDPARVRLEATEARVVRQLFAWYTAEGLSMPAIAARLRHLQRPTSRGGSHGHPATVKGILSHEVYAGTAYGHRDDEVEPRRWRGGRSAAERQRHHPRHRPRDEWIAVDVPPLVSHERFARVQALRPLRPAESRRNNTRRDSLLRARVRCAVCGLAASGRPRGAHTYDLCNGHLSRVSTGRAQQCRVRTIRGDRLDSMVWDDICRLLSTPEISTEALHRARAGELVQDDRDARLQHRQQARRRAERQIERLVAAFTAEGITLDDLKARRAVLQNRLQGLVQQERDLHAQHQQHRRLADLCAHLKALCESLHTGLHTLDFARRRRMVELLVDRVLFSHEEIEIRYAIPLKGLGQKGTLQLPYRTHAQLDESVPACVDPLGQESAELCGVSAFGLCLYDVQTIWPTGIGS